MSGPDRYNSNVARLRRSPGGDPQSSFFQGQGGRTVLPPLSSAFPTSHFPVPSQYAYSQPYSQPRSSPGRGDYQFAYPQLTMNSVSSYPSSSSSYVYDDPCDIRYPSPPNPNYPPRPTPHHGDISQGRRNAQVMPPGANSERWTQSSAHALQPTQFSGSNSGRPPANAYAASYSQYPTSHSAQYSYSSGVDPRSMPHPIPYVDQISLTEAPIDRGGSSRPAPHARTAAAAPYPQPGPPTEETTQVKKKRKRADAAQLEVLNEVYNRTAFPSTEERAELARRLDMTPRSVQIWFQNKRQSMRQTSKQNALASSPREPYGTSPPDLDFEEIPQASVGEYGGGIGAETCSTSSPYPSRLGDDPRSHSSHSPCHGSPKESVESRTWSGRY